MGTEIRGGNSQVGTLNRQFIESSVITNSHNNFTVNINVNCTECRQHQHLEGVSSSQGNVHHVIECLQKVAVTSDQPTRQIVAESYTQPHSEVPITSKCKQETQAKSEVVNNRGVKVPCTDQQDSSSTTISDVSAVSDSVKILDSWGQVLEPGDAVKIGRTYHLYVGYGCTVWCDRCSKTVMKEKLDMTHFFYKLNPVNHSYLTVFLSGLRVQRALQQIGKECPVKGRRSGDFVYWTFTGLGLMQSKEQEFYLNRPSRMKTFRAWSRRLHTAAGTADGPQHSRLTQHHTH